LGEGLTEAQLVRWLVGVGETIAVDAPVAEVETAKAIVEVPSPFAGVIAELHGAEGGTLDVGAPLISVDSGGEPALEAGSSAGPGTSVETGTSIESAAAASYVEEERAGSGNVLIGYGTSELPATGRRRGRRRPAVQACAQAENPVRAPERAGAERPRVKSPLVRQLARRTGVDLTTLPGSGPTGLITRADVERASQVAPAAVPSRVPDEQPPATSDRRTGLPIRERIPLRGVRKAIAQTLQRSRTEIPEATTWVDVDATELVELRASLATPDRRPPSLLAFLARFTVAGLGAFPELNARIDTEREEIVQLAGVNLGIATQTDRGLLVPAVAAADRLGVRAMDTAIRAATEAARAGATDPTRGSFTLNNYGGFGVDGSAAIINHPEVAILGIGRIIQRPWVVDGEVVARYVGQLSLVFDHRACDGATAGGFLRHVADAVEHPLRAVVEG
ncbi:MAG TPA: dihydrolipoamide acetyltransferase family protein, partial [Pseudonocardia sp.]|nr:dihydrolipoamide acetyltransferase family protein [Pseudonocardia sp.]